MRIIGSAIALTVLAACGEPAPGTNGAGTPPVEPEMPEALAVTASWTLDETASRLGFASVKAGEIIESHSFPGISGTVTPDGTATISIPLDQVETNVDIRNERMRNMFFETAEFPTATITASLDPDRFGEMLPGDRMKMPLDAVLSLHGIEQTISTDVFVTRIGNASVEVATVDPIVVFADDFGLAAGVEMLRNVANLPAITSASPVTFNLVFDAQ